MIDGFEFQRLSDEREVLKLGKEKKVRDDVGGGNYGRGGTEAGK